MAKRVIISTTDLRAGLTTTDIRSVVASTLLSAEFAFDPNSVNQWFYDQYGFADAPVITFNKGTITEAFAVTDAPAFGVSRLSTDAFGFTDTPSLVVQFNRSFTDAFAMDDAATVDALRKDTNNAKGNIFGVSDSQALGVGKGLSDSFPMSESISSIGVSKTADADAFTVSESFAKTVAFSRSPTDSYSFTDNVTQGVGKGASDSVTVAESLAAALSLAKTDSLGITETYTSSVGKAASDSVSLSDVFSRVATFSRTFTDAFSLDDSATVDALVKDTTNAKTNVFGFADSQVFGVTKGVTDSFSFADDQDFSVGKGLSDSVSMSENFSFSLFSNAAMNAAPLNASPFNQ